MARDPRRKEKQRLKRQQKQLQRRKEHNVSLARRLADGQTLDCRINADHRDTGMASIVMLRQLRGGQTVLGGFMVDLWCAGLKDAWVRLDGSREIYDKHMEYTRSMGVTMVACDLELARRLVAGGVRFGRQNGFRQPPDWERCVSILDGPLPDIDTADLSDFGTEDGKLRFIGPRSFLEERLLGSVEDFLKRPDVDWVMESDVPLREDWDEDEDEQGEDDNAARLGDALEAMTDIVTGHIVQECARDQVEPADGLRDGVALVVGSIWAEGLRAEHPIWESGRLSEPVRQRVMHLMEKCVAPEQHPALLRGVEQVEWYMQRHDGMLFKDDDMQ